MGCGRHCKVPTAQYLFSHFHSRTELWLEWQCVPLKNYFPDSCARCNSEVNLWKSFCFPDTGISFSFLLKMRIRHSKEQSLIILGGKPYGRAGRQEEPKSLMTSLSHGTNLELASLCIYCCMRKINPNGFMPLLVKFSVATQCIHNGETSKLMVEIFKTRDFSYQVYIDKYTYV